MGDIVGATIGWEVMSMVLMQDHRVDLPDSQQLRRHLGSAEVDNDPGLASFKQRGHASVG